MNHSLLALYLLSIILLIATPGPVVALILNTSAREGFRRAFLSILGTNGASLLLISTSSLIISGLLSLHRPWLKWLSLGGCLILLWYAIHALRSAFGKHPIPDSQAPNAPSSSSASTYSALLHGFMVGISNPKDIFFFAAFFPQFMAITGHHHLSLAILTLLWIICDFLILLGYAAMLKITFFKQRQHWISKLSAIFLMAIAVGGLWYAIREMTA